MSSDGTGIESGDQEVKQLIGRLRPGDTIEYETNKGHEVVHDVVETRLEDGFHRVYAEGPEGGRYLLMADKPEGMGNHPAPEVFWVNPDPEEGSNTYEVITRGSITALSLTTRRS